MRAWTVLALATTMALGGLTGCGDDDASPDAGRVVTDMGPADDSGRETDAALDEDTGSDDAGSTEFACEFASPHGVVVGSTMSPVATVMGGNSFELQTCDGEGFAFPDQATCDAKLTVISIAAGWCGPCIAESRAFERVINQHYAATDVRLLQVIIQKEDRSPPDAAYCENWVNRFGLTNTEVIDPAQLLQPFFPDNSLPSTVIINSSGEIVHRENGISDENLSSLRTRLDLLLADI